MAVTYGFYNSVNNDRKYDAEQLSAIFNGVIHDGVFSSVDEALIVEESANMKIAIGAGRAWFNNTWTENDNVLLLTVDDAELILDRIDAVVLEVNSDVGTRQNAIKIIKGVPDAAPDPPALSDTATLHQYPLAYIAVNAGVVEILEGDITDMRGGSECPLIDGILESKDYYATIPVGGWSGGPAPYTNDIIVSGIEAADIPTVDIVLPGVYLDDIIMNDNWALIYRIVTEDGNIVVYASDVPSADVDIILRVVR